MGRIRRVALAVALDVEILHSSPSGDGMVGYPKTEEVDGNDEGERNEPGLAPAVEPAVDPVVDPVVEPEGVPLSVSVSSLPYSFQL